MGLVLLLAALMAPLPGEMAPATPTSSYLAPEAAAGFPAPVKPPVPTGDPGTWVTPDDYPKESLGKGVQGIVGFALDVDSAGRVDKCILTQSSGALDLDQATCQLITARALFSPASDARGQPVPGRWRSRVRWILPSQPPPPGGTVVTRATVQADGTVTDCFVEITGDMALKPGAPKSGPCSSTRDYLTGYVDGQGRPVARRLIITQRVEVVPVGDDPAPVAGQKPVAPVTGRGR